MLCATDRVLIPILRNFYMSHNACLQKFCCIQLLYSSLKQTVKVTMCWEWDAEFNEQKATNRLDFLLFRHSSFEAVLISQLMAATGHDTDDVALEHLPPLQYISPCLLVNWLNWTEAFAGNTFMSTWRCFVSGHQKGQSDTQIHGKVQNWFVELPPLRLVFTMLACISGDVHLIFDFLFM